MEAKAVIEHDLRKEFHNMLGILKIIDSEGLIKDEEVRRMIDLCIEREQFVSTRFEELSQILGKNNV